MGQSHNCSYKASLRCSSALAQCRWALHCCPNICNSSSHLYADPNFSYTSGIWLANHDAQVAGRYVKFDLPALHHAAAKAMGARAVTSMTKISENLNRVFLLSFDNDTQAIVCFPTPFAGPAHYLTASEVATMDFLRRVGVPVPKVYAWCSRAEESDVGAEYILMENVHGKALDKMYEDEELDEQAVRTVGAVLEPLTRLRFQNYGSIYYTRDLPEDRRMPLQIDSLPEDVQVDDLCLGPATRNDCWFMERGEIAKVPRGPWSSADQLLFDIAGREQLWLTVFAHPTVKDDYLRILPGQGKTQDHIDALNDFKALIPYIVPREPRHLAGHLWHPDLHADNILVAASDAPGGFSVTSIIDWQCSWVGPAFINLNVPTMFQATIGTPSGHRPAVTPNPVALAEVSPEDREEAMRMHRLAILHKLFEDLVIPQVLDVPVRARWQLIDCAASTWEIGLLPFMKAMIKVVDRWEEIAGDKPCPVHFTEEQLEFHGHAYATWLNHQQNGAQVVKELMGNNCKYSLYVPITDPDMVAYLKNKIEERRQKWMAKADNADNDAYRLLLELTWPFRASADSGTSHIVIHQLSNRAETPSYYVTIYDNMRLQNYFTILVKLYIPLIVIKVM
ncbi:hypothetical protein FISHEDRAFT_54147 [Fistulina hepatica ATCC 64428]|uniref:Aminoglycoside phosphotransferase domain-containing protein n=1 Tax=Fistulina hepatica ATCC 64428 TaxID=1128425 RepID=A0A0D6ZZ31_9AGAR|nr:hypothetical protein FISHEDRAFT_54147 [Fistulina hepatica ATCC 64428]